MIDFLIQSHYKVVNVQNGNEGEDAFPVAPYDTIIRKIERCFWGGDTSVPIFVKGTPGTDKKYR